MRIDEESKLLGMRSLRVHLLQDCADFLAVIPLTKVLRHNAINVFQLYLSISSSDSVYPNNASASI